MIKRSILLLVVANLFPFFAHAQVSNEPSWETASPVSAEQIRLKNNSSPTRLSPDYARGKELIYDCRHGHWACVDQESAKVCRKKRVQALKKGRSNLPCQTLRTHDTQAGCVLHLYHLINRPRFLSFCFAPNASRLFTLLPASR